MTWVKICGITNLEDALTAVQAGANALGFVFHDKSPRYVSPQTAHDILRQIPDTIEKVGVFAGASEELVRKIAEQVGLNAVQLHVDASSERGRVRSFELAEGVRRYAAFSAPHLLEQLADLEVLFSPSVDQAEKNRPDAIFLDSGTLQRPGGTGQVFHWEKAIPLVEKIKQSGFKLVVAGGLTPENVAKAMRTLRPWGVDVSSGVEARPGKKDAEKVRAFLTAVRSADKG